MNKTSKYRIFSFLIVALFITSFIQFIGAQNRNISENKVILYFFYGRGCPHCALMEPFLENMSKKDHSLEIRKFEVYFNKTNRKLFEKVAAAYNKKVEGVPTVFIDNRVFVGYSTQIAKEIESKINECLHSKCISPEDKLKSSKTKTIEGLTWATLIGAAAVDSINPCTLAVLILLLTTLIASERKNKIAGTGLAFTAAIYVSYFLMGLGVYSAVKTTGYLHTIYYAIISIALLVGFMSIKDYFNYKPGFFAVEIPMRWRPLVKKIIGEITSVPGAAAIGLFCSLFLIPCSSGPYLVILGLLAKTSTRMTAIPLLLIYNFIFVLPMILITFLIYFGKAKVEQISAWREKYIKLIHLISGIIMIGLAILLVFAMHVGWV